MLSLNEMRPLTLQALLTIEDEHSMFLSCPWLEVEWIPTKSRTLVGTTSSFFFTFGQMILAGLAYSLRDWRKLQIAVCSPFFIFFIYSW